ncbi:MAG: hypothetical protein AABZ30_11905 [Myxococcota bacterium]
MRSVHRGSSLYALDDALLARLDPDVLLTQELCDVCAVSYATVREAVRVIGGERNVVSLEPTSLAGILATIEEVGRVCLAEERATALVGALRARIAAVESAAAGAPRPRVAAVEWLDPPFSGGTGCPR